MNNLHIGYLVSTCTRRPASFTCRSIPQEIAPTTIHLGWMVSPDSLLTGDSKRRERASGLVFLDQGRMERVKIKWQKKSD